MSDKPTDREGRAKLRPRINKEQLRVLATQDMQMRPSTATIDSDITCDVYCWWWSVATK